MQRGKNCWQQILRCQYTYLKCTNMHIHIVIGSLQPRYHYDNAIDKDDNDDDDEVASNVLMII